MSERDAPPDSSANAAGEPLLARWSRLKADARARDTRPSPTGATQPAREAEPARSGAEPVAAGTAVPAPVPPIELPDIDQLDQDSDFSAFLTPGVDAELRKRALRKLFHSPKFNVFDGLDTYRDDFTSFPALGSVVTADMRYHIERAARELAARTEAAVRNDSAAAEPAAIAPDGSGADAAIQHAPPQEIATDAVALPPATSAEPTTARNEDDGEHGPA